MASPQRRPRDKGGTSLHNNVANGFASSNSTVTKFLGGIQKGWMMGDQKPAERPPIHRPQWSKSMTPRVDVQNARLENLPPAGSVAQSRKNPSENLPMENTGLASSPDLRTPTMASQADLQASKRQTSQANTVLPSPAPSDEPRQESIHIIDLEGEEEQEVPNDQQIGIVQQTQEQHDIPSTRYVAGEQANQPNDQSIAWNDRLPETREDTGDIRDNEQSREILQTDRHNAATAASPFSAPSASLENAMRKRTTREQSTSNKRVQMANTNSPAEPISLRSEVSAAGEPNSMVNAFSFSPTEAEMRQFIGRIGSRLEYVQRAQPQRGSIEDGRLLLLRDACECYDHDYLLLHQLHCMKTKDPGCVHLFSALGFGAQHLQGLNILDQLILANAKLVDDAVEWFSDFPLPNRELVERYAAYELSYGRVLRCLEKLAEFWQPLRKSCQERHYAPLVDELNAIDLRSVVLQRVISRAILRNIWLLPQDDCFYSSEKLFLINQQDVYQRDIQIATSPARTDAAKKTYNQKLIISYQRLWDQHQLHHSQFEQHYQVRSDRSFSNITPQGSSQRGQPQQNQVRFLPARSANGNNVNLFDQAHRPHPLNLIAQPDQRNGQVVPRQTFMLPSSPAEVQMGPISWSRSLAGQSSPLSVLPPPGTILQSNAETPETSQGPTGQTILASTTFNGRLQDQHPQRDPSRSSIPGALPPARISESPMSSTQPCMGLDNMSTRAVGRPVPPSRGSPAGAPSSPQISQVSDTHRQHVGTRRQSHFHSQLPARRVSVNMVNGQLDSQGETQRLRGQLLYTLPPQFLPPPSYIQETTAHPNPVESALHQAHVRSPIFKAINPEGVPDNTTKYYRFMWGLAVMPNRLHIQKRHVRWTFTVSKESVQLLAKSIGELDGSPPITTVGIGSRLCRIRCIQVSDASEDVSEDDWAVAETAWPRNVAIILNGTALEIRRKHHHGKDIPIDVSHYIQEGQNTLSIATLWLPQDTKAVYAVGLETLQVTTDKKIKEDIATLGRSEAQKRIIERASNLDPEVQIIDPSIVLDVTDPYTSIIFEVPVRGKNCRHNQCFDLDVFLQTRTSKSSNQPCEPDQFKCPICGGDARPQSLIIDQFFVEVRQELSRTVRLDARAIVLHESGDWQIQEVEETGEPGDGSGRRLSRAEDVLAARTGKGPIRRDSEVIEIDGD